MGEGGEYSAALDRMRRDGVEFHPPYSAFADLPPDRYGLFLMTSEWEGTPLTLLDAIAYRLPVVAPAVGGIPEVVDETTGYLVPRFDDVNAYVDHIAAVIADPAGADERAQRGIARLAADHSWSAWETAVAATGDYLGAAHD
jgi:glycosyltransferase involved in cell wall biosynthesis